ncbi:hypothetical protein FG386_002561 [Cryptosporidium ryanae]|uniref:uncharacterized protein n=1 Tax=Cryptosporidium ryanae TaxID=515981 RepID=UPI00351A0081|nr:hypothetical protein FG386_002561 [Cryptosporidium ryanae]
MYFQRKEVLGEPPILASFGSIRSQSSKKRKLSPTFQFFVGIGYIVYLITTLLVISLVIQPNELYSSIYSIQNSFKSANWNPDTSTPKNLDPKNIQTNDDIQNWITYVLGPILLNGYISDQNQVIGASLSKCIGEYTFNNSSNNLVPSDYGIVNTLETSNCNESKMNLISRISEPYKYFENFFNSSDKFIIQEIEETPTIPTIPKKSKRTDIVSYKIELLIYNANLEAFTVVTFSFNLSIFGNYVLNIHSQTATSINKLIGFPCVNCNFTINQIMKILLFFIYCSIFVLHFIPGIILLFSSLCGSKTSNEKKNSISVESWSNYFKERSLSIAIRLSHFSIITLWIASALIIQILPNLELKTILEESNRITKEIINGNSSEIPFLNLIIHWVQISSILKFIGTTIGCLSTFLILFRIFQIFSSLFSQVNVPLKTMVLYFKKIAGIYFFINTILLALALGLIIYIQIDKYSAIIRGFKSSFTTSLFLLFLSPFHKIGWEGNINFTDGNMTAIIFVSTILGIVSFYLTFVPLSTATIMFIFNEVELLQSLKQNTDNIYTIKTTLNSWIQQLFFLSTFWASSKTNFFSNKFPFKTSKDTPDSQDKIVFNDLPKVSGYPDDIKGEKKCQEKIISNWKRNKLVQMANFFKIPPKLEFIPYHLFLILILFFILSIVWIVHVVNYQLEEGTGDIVWRILNFPFKARSFYTFDPTKQFSPYMFQDCSHKKKVDPPFLYDETQLENIPPELIYGLFQSFNLGNLTSINQIKTWMERILIPSILSKSEGSKKDNRFLIDIGYPTLSPILNPIFLIKQHFNPAKCNSNPKTSGLYLSKTIETKTRLDLDDITDYNISSIVNYDNLPFKNEYSIENSNLNETNLYLRTNSFAEQIEQIESSFSSSGVDRIFVMYSGTQDKLMEQFNKTLNGNDEGNLFWVIKSYSLSKGSDSQLHLVHSFDKLIDGININSPYSGLFDFNMSKMTLYFPILIPLKSSVSLITVDFNMSPTGMISISYNFDTIKPEWITQDSGEIEIIVDQKLDTEISAVMNNSKNGSFFSVIILGMQGSLILILVSILIYNSIRKKYLNKKILNKVNYELNISDQESEEENMKKKHKKFRLKKISRRKKQIHDELNEDSVGDENRRRIIVRNEKKDLLEFRKRKIMRKIKTKQLDDEGIEINDSTEYIDDEDILKLYKLNNANLISIIILSITFLVFFCLCLRYYFLIVTTKIAINPNSIDFEGGFNSIPTSTGISLPWEVAINSINKEDFDLNMIGSNSGFYNDKIFSIKKLINTINDIKRISGYFFMFELFAALIIITFIAFLVLYSGILIKRHKKIITFKARRHFEKTGENILENSLESVSLFTFIYSASQMGFSWRDANYAFFPIFCVVFSFIILFSLTGYSILGYQEAQFFSFYYSFISSLMMMYNYNSMKDVMLSYTLPELSIRFYISELSFIMKPIYFIFTFFTFNFILKALIPASIIFYMRSIASKNLQVSQDALLSKLNKVAVTRPSIPIFVNDSITLRMKFFIKALYIKLGKIKHLDKQNSFDEEIINEQNDSNIKLSRDNPDWIFAKLIPELFNEIIHYKLNISELVNKDQQGIQEIRDYLSNISLQLLLIQEHLVKIEFLRCKLSMIRQELMKIEDVKKDISRGNRESQHYLNRLLQRLMSINDEIEHLDQSNKVLSQEKEMNRQKNILTMNLNNLKKEKDKSEHDYLFEYDHSYAKELFENSKINDLLSESDPKSSGTSESEASELESRKGMESIKNRNSDLNFRNGIIDSDDEKIEKRVEELWRR